MTSEEKTSLLKDFIAQLRAELARINFPTLGELATVFIAGATVVVGMGAAIFWIRTGNADLPQLQTLALIPQQELVIIGARELALPMIFWSALNVLSFPLGLAAGTRRARRKPPSKWSIGLVVGIPRGLALGVFFSYPLTWSTVTFAVMLLLYSFLAEHPELLNLKVAVIMAALVSFCIGLANEADAPTRLDKAVVETVTGEEVEGYYISTTGQGVYLGRGGVIEGIPTRRIEKIVITHPPEGEKDKPPSILGRAIAAVTGLL